MAKACTPKPKKTKPKTRKVLGPPASRKPPSANRGRGKKK